MIDFVTEIVAALAAGAVASVKDTASQAVKDAYKGLKGLLVGKLPSLHSLEEDPRDEDVRKVAAKELEKKGLAADTSVVEKVRDLIEALEREPAERLAEWAIDIGQIRAAKSVIIKHLESKGGGTRIRDVEAKSGDVRIEGVKSSREPGKN
jgi:hypothetical protein